MQRYVEQIIEDLKEAKENVPPEPDFGNSYEEFADTMMKLETAPSIAAKKLFGVSYKELPLAKKLTNEQMLQIIDAIEDTFLEFKIEVSLSDNVPTSLKYELIRSIFAEDIFHMPGYSTTQDFCSGWCPECKILDYCESVHEIWTKEELEKEQKKIETEKNNINGRK